MEDLVVQILNGVSSSMILVLISLGLSVIFGMLRVINLAHGEFFMLGAYCVATAVMLGVSPWWGIIFSTVVVGAIGMEVERFLIRPLYRRPLETLLATWGLSIILRQIVRIIYGPGQKMAWAVITGSTRVAGVEYPTYRLFIIVLTLLLIVLAFLTYFKTGFGLRIRMVIANREMAEALGVDINSVHRWTFGIASAMVGFAGAIMSPLVVINPDMGLDYLARAFIVIIVGGVGYLAGVLGGGVIIGGGEAALSYYLRPVVAQILVMMFAVFVIRVRPRGLFG